MDRNLYCSGYVCFSRVALRKESVDRNDNILRNFLNRRVALRKESVDRNIGRFSKCYFVILVALRKESVDRNVYLYNFKMFACVALRKESVDRNNFLVVAIAIDF